MIKIIDTPKWATLGEHYTEFILVLDSPLVKGDIVTFEDGTMCSVQRDSYPFGNNFVGTFVIIGHDYTHKVSLKSTKPGRTIRQI